MPFFVPLFVPLLPFLVPQLVIDSRICMLTETETESCNSLGYVMRLSSRLQTQFYILYIYDMGHWSPWLHGK